MKPTYDRAKSELSSSLVRLLTGKRKNVFLGSFVVILILGIAGGTYALMGNNAEPPAASPTPVQDPAVPVEPEVSLADQMAYIVPVTEESGTATAPQLVIRFRNEADRDALQTDKLQLKLADGTVVELEDATSEWESFNRNEEPDAVDSADSESQGAAEGNSGDSSDGSSESTSTDTTDDTQSSNEISQDSDSTTTSDSTESTNESSQDGTETTPSGSSNRAEAGEGGSAVTEPITVEAADRLYPFGQQVSLPADMDPANIVSIQSGTTVIELSSQPEA